MATYKVVVKWNKKLFKDVEVNTAEDVATFKAQLFTLTGVPPARQKIMGLKGGILSDSALWSKTGIANGKKLMLMGTAEKLPSAPVKKAVFLEDLTADEAGLLLTEKLPAGLSNLGNTCYMNSSLQCLRAVPEIQDALKNYGGSSAGGADGMAKVAQSMKELFLTLDRSVKPIPPYAFLMAMRQIFPQFAEQARPGVYAQQDAEECYSLLLSTLKRVPGIPESSVEKPPSLGEQLFGGTMRLELKCQESETETPSVQSEAFTKLSVNIGAETRFLLPGLLNNLTGAITKRSATLGRDALYVKTSRISKLPYMLNIQFVRFYWKASAKLKAKIVKSVDFPFELDIFSLCTPELQKELGVERKRILDAEEALLAKKTASTAAGEPGAPSDKSEEGAEPMEISTGPEEAPAPVTKAATPSGPPSFKNTTGRYELAAVLTHKGRSADSGHYVAWVREKGDNWLLFDDDKVIPKEKADIEKLVGVGKGAGDWHIAYVCLYRTKQPEL